MATSLSVPPQREMSLEDRRLHALWQALPEHPVDEETAFELIERAADRPGDHAFASPRLLNMCDLGIVTCSGGLYTRAEEFPSLPEDYNMRYGTEAFNAALERDRAEDRRKRDIADAEAQKRYQDSPLMRERRERREEMVEVVHEEVDAGRTTVLEAQMRALRAEVAGLKQQLAGNHIAA